MSYNFGTFKITFISLLYPLENNELISQKKIFSPDSNGNPVVVSLHRKLAITDCNG